MNKSKKVTSLCGHSIMGGGARYTIACFIYAFVGM
jgi:hypothetical protein